MSGGSGGGSGSLGSGGGGGGGGGGGAAAAASAPQLAALFVFNPTLGDEETEGEKILFFFPSLDVNRQKDYVGICEGLVAFTRDFSPLRPCEAVHCERHRYAFREIERDYWLVAVVENPSVAREGGGKGGGGGGVEYLEDELDDAVLQSILGRAAGLLQLFNGPLSRVLAAQGAGELRRRLAVFFRYFVPVAGFKRLRAFTDMVGMQFVPADRNTFLAVHSAAAALTQALPGARAAVAMFGASLAWSGLPQDDAFLLYQVEQDTSHSLYTYAHVHHMHLALQQQQQQQQQQQPDAPADDKAAAAAPPAAALSQPPLEGLVLGGALPGGLPPSAPQVFLRSGDAPGEEERVAARLVVRRREGLAIFLVVDEAAAPRSAEWFASLERALDADHARLLGALRQQAARAAEGEERFRFLYFNHVNLALKTTLNHARAPQLSLDTIRLIREVHADFAAAFAARRAAAARAAAAEDGDAADALRRLDESVSEVFVRTRSEGWLVGRRADHTQREFFVLVDERVVNLVEVLEEVERLAKTYFLNVFIY